MRNEADFYKNAGNDFFKVGDYSNALKRYKEGLEIDNYHPELNCNASAAAFNIGLFKEAEIHAVRAFQSKKNYEKAYVRAIKAAQRRNNIVRQVDYVLQGMENCKPSGALLDEAENIQQKVVVSSFCQSSEVEEFFKHPKANEKLSLLEELINQSKAKYRKKTTPENLEAMMYEGSETGFYELFAEFAKSAAHSLYAKSGKKSGYKKPKPAQVTKGGVGVPFPKAPPPSKVPPDSPRSSQDPEKKLKTNGKQLQDPKRLLQPKQTQDHKKIQEPKQTQDPEQVTRASIVQEVMTLLNNGREAFKNSFFPVAATYLTKAQTLVKENSLEELQDFALFKLPLSYVICEVKVLSGTYKDLEGGILSLRKLVEGEGTRKFPAGVYLLGLAYIKLNRFVEARQQLEKVDALISSNITFNTYPWPGTFDVIEATKKAYLETAVNELLRHCGAYHKPNWVCLFDECEKISSHIMPSRKIYFNDPDFAGYVELTCGAKCSLVFHCHCWKAYKEHSSIKRPTDKAILGEPCLTPDCESPIVGIATFDKSGQATHRDSIPYEPPDKRRNPGRAKTNDPAVPKQASATKSKKLRSSCPSGSPVKSTLSAKRGTDEVIVDEAAKEVNFEEELKRRKTKLENIRNTDKHWQHFTLDALTSTEFELVEEERYVESFFEEVLKNEGPIHISRVEDFYRENKAIIEQAIPAFRTFQSLLYFLLNRSHRFVLMDLLLGLASDLVDLFKMTKEDVMKRIKMPRTQKSQDFVIKTNCPAGNDDAAKHNRGLELPRSPSPGHTGTVIQKLATIELKPSLIPSSARTVGTAEQQRPNQIDTSVQVPTAITANQKSAKRPQTDTSVPVPAVTAKQQPAKPPSQVTPLVPATANQQLAKRPVQTDISVSVPAVTAKQDSAKTPSQVTPVPATANQQSAKRPQTDTSVSVPAVTVKPDSAKTPSQVTPPVPAIANQQSAKRPVQTDTFVPVPAVTAKPESAKTPSAVTPPVPATANQQSAKRPVKTDTSVPVPTVTAKQESAKTPSQIVSSVPATANQQSAERRVQTDTSVPVPVVVTVKQQSPKGPSQATSPVPATANQQSAKRPVKTDTSVPVPAVTAKQESAKTPSQIVSSVPATANHQSAKRPVQTDTSVPVPAVVTSKQQSAKGPSQAPSAVPATAHQQSAGPLPMVTSKQQSANGIPEIPRTVPATNIANQLSAKGPHSIAEPAESSGVVQRQPSVATRKPSERSPYRRRDLSTEKNFPEAPLKKSEISQKPQDDKSSEKPSTDFVSGIKEGTKVTAKSAVLQSRSKETEKSSDLKRPRVSSSSDGYDTDNSSGDSFCSFKSIPDSSDSGARSPSSYHSTEGSRPYVATCGLPISDSSDNEEPIAKKPCVRPSSPAAEELSGTANAEAPGNRILLDKGVSSGSCVTPKESEPRAEKLRFESTATKLDIPILMEEVSKPPVAELALEEKLLEESPPFEDLFVIEDADKLRLSDVPEQDLLPVEMLLKDFQENEDLFAIDEKPLRGIDDLFEVPQPKLESSRGFDALKHPAEDSSRKAVCSEEPADGKVDSQVTKCSDRWKPTEEVMDFVRLSFPREEYSRLIEGLGIICEKRGREINNMSVEDIVEELSNIFKLSPALQQSSARGGSTDVPQQNPSADFYDEEEMEGMSAIPWKPPVSLVQAVRLSFPTEEFYKLMFALYLAKVYSNFTRFEDLCDHVAKYLNEINEGKCGDYNLEISTHGPYNKASRDIYARARSVTINVESTE